SFGFLVLIAGLGAGSLIQAKAQEQESSELLVVNRADIFIPEKNPMTPEKIELGKQLYFDPRLSSSGTISCNSCHNVMAGGDDSVRTSFGIHGKRGERNSPTVWNSAFLSVQFWDGRENTLEDQAKGPITNPVEMGMKNHDVAVDRIRQIPGYREAFAKVFGGRAGSKSVVTIDRVVQAIASYERTLITEDAPFDRFQKGDKGAISAEAKKGWETFQKVGCTSCHSGAYFAGPKLPIGTGFFMKFPTISDADIEKKYEISKDLGRYAVTKSETDKNFWRVAPLRNIALTAPYFHNGSVNDLGEAVRVMAKVQLGQSLSKSDTRSIVAFLNTLTGEFPAQTLPRLPDYQNSTFLE
ncbi:MAG: cytochrome c peroxidase, partial [Bdellovibrionales bacterium]|nr:cytochrome c peroxidase [Bdellovibrionales bacterium]